MKAVWYERNGSAREVLKLGEMPDPKPGRGEVRVRMAVSGLNPSDVKRREGSRGQVIEFPRVIPNSDGGGVVDAVGPGASESWVGERVWVWNAQWGRAFGTCAEYCVLPESQVRELPEGIGFDEGACLGIPAMTAHQALFSDGDIRGQTILVTGGAGSVGYYAIQMAKWAGAMVIATVSSAEKAAIGEEAGGATVIGDQRQGVAGHGVAFAHAVDPGGEGDFGAHLPGQLEGPERN